MRFVSPVLGSLILILLVAIPVGGTPALQKGSNATYDLKAQISFAPPICQASPSSTALPSLIMCPMIVALPLSTNITGTLGWSVTSLSGTTAVLNVSKDVAISHDGLMIPDRHITSSFNETIDLATRIISTMPFLRTEMNNALQLDQTTATSASLSAGINPNIGMAAVEPAPIDPHPVYTMWWMNETLHQGQNVTVLVFPTKVVGAATFDFQGKARPTWTLVFNRTQASPQPEIAATTSGWAGDGLAAIFRFEYDQTSGLLLSATADIHVGFIEAMTQPVQCASSTATPSTVCSSSASTMILTRSCGFTIHASLTLASTNLNLDGTVGTSGSTQTGGTTSSGPGSSGSPGGNSGGSSGGNNGGYGGGTGQGSGGTNGGPNAGSGSNPGGTPSLASGRPAPGLAPWIYLVLAAVTVAIVAVALWIARRQSKKSSSEQTTSQQS